MESNAAKGREDARYPGEPSRPRVAGIWRLVLFLALLALACGAIWWIDRGVNLTNSHP